LIERLSDGKCDIFDVGLARGPWGKRYFFEGAGAGLFAEYLKVPRKDGEKAKAKPKTEEMRYHVRACDVDCSIIARTDGKFSWMAKICQTVISCGTP